MLSPDVPLPAIFSSRCFFSRPARGVAGIITAPINGKDVKYGIVGDASSQCPRGCIETALNASANNNPGADGMASVISHELSETITDPDVDAWYNDGLGENADRCAWKFGKEYTTPSGAPANMKLGTRNFLIQQNWVNAKGGYCSLSW